MKRKILFLAVALLLVFGIAQVAGAAGVGWNVVDPGKTLNLTDEQKVKMREINQNNYNQTRELRIKAMDTRHELKQMWLQPNPDQTKVEAKAKELKELQTRIQDIRQQNRQDCQSLLTPEQQNQLKQFKNKRGGKCPGNNGPTGGAGQ